MDGAPASDKSLLERLNALKPSSVSLISQSSSISNPTLTSERAESPSREDALTARLKSLRNQVSESAIDSAATDQGYGVGESTQPHPAKQTRSPTGSEVGIQQAPTSVQVTDDVDPLLYTDDQTLEELLEDLRSDETWLDEVAAEEEEHQRITTLLTELSKSSGVSAVPDKQSTNPEASQEGSERSSDDDSEGEIQVDSVLAKAMDEVEWEMVNKAPSSPPGDAKQASRDGNIPSPNDGAFNLPTVPSELQDQPDLPTLSTQPQSDGDFAASIASRMAALKLSGPRTLPSAPTVAVDSLGLPQAPTFAPADRPVPGLAKRTGLTDEDQKTWCVVCLEDGTVRCLGCEAGDDVYCARCWKEMHVGPQAGYDERGHSWEIFVSRPR
ncbi:hypothetical protein E0Z10_g6725 [Xylaria hypoxylon]|uniref:Abscission/NoCut checkpoint regulator n=1 Tax=Xylaria hypoxylon TaxID=37992 RepID=A0A4Z0YFH5_9PEZI|nr:hypothetical protein E0Z10_g6725 [Xylaria hypoxylon]